MNALFHLEKSLTDLTKKSEGRRVFLQSLPLLLAGCASTPKHRTREGDNKGQKTSMSVQDEIVMARDYAPELEKKYPILSNRSAQRYIERLGQRLVRDSDLDGNPYDYEFHVVDSKLINAFALPAGKIYITRPLILASESEAELSGVVAHEIGHVKARHTAERIEAQKKNQKKSLLIGLGGAVLGGAAGYGLGKLICSQNNRDCLRRISKYGALAGGSGGLLISKFAFMAHGREDELEADRISFRVAYESGYHRDHIGKFYWKLQDMESKRGHNPKVLRALSDALSTHPPSAQRVRQIKELIRSTPLKGKLIQTKEFESLKRGLA